MGTLLEAGFSEDRAATVYHVLGAYTLGLGYARMLGDEVQTTDIVAQLIGHWADYPSMMRVGMRLAVWDRPGEFETGLDVLLAHFADRPGVARVTARGEARRARCAARRPPAPRQDDQPGQDGRRQPLLALDQVLALPAARPRHPGRLPRPGRRGRPQDEHVETLRLDDEPDLVVIQVYITSARRAYRSPTTTAPAARTSCLGGLHADAPARGGRAPTPTRRSAGPARTPGRASSPTSAPAGPAASTARTRAPSPACRRRAATSSSATSTSCPTRSSSRAAARTSATSATRRRSSRAAGPSTCRRSTRRSPRSTACPAATSTSSTTTSSATRRSPRRSSTACAGMGRLWQAAGTVDVGAPPRPAREGGRGGLRSLFVGFETLDAGEPARAAARRRTWAATTAAAVRRLHDLGVMVNGELRLRHGRRRRDGLRRARWSGPSRRASRRRPSTS